MNTQQVRLLLAGIAALSLLVSVPAEAQTKNWTNTAGDSEWTTSTNWSPSGAPTTSSDVVINVVPTGDIIGIDEGGGTADANTITFGTGLNGFSITIVPATSDTLQVNGNITNSSTSLQSFTIPVLTNQSTTTSATYAGGPGGLSFGDLSIFTAQIATSGSVTVNGRLVINIEATNPGQANATFGTIGPITTTSSTTVAIDGAYTGVATLAADTGDFFKLTTGSFAGATAPNLPTFTDTNLTWVSTLIQKGILFVEPTAGTTVINTGVVLPIGNNSEFNPSGADTDIVMNGGELVTSNNGPLDTGTFTNGAAFVTARTVDVNSAGGIIAATAGTTGTYTGIFANGNASTGTLTFGDAVNTGTVVSTGTSTFAGVYSVAHGTFELDGKISPVSSSLFVGTSGTLTGTGRTEGVTTLTGNGVINLGSGAVLDSTLIATGGNWNGAGTVTGQVTQQTSGTLTIGSGANLTGTDGIFVTGGALAGTGTLTGSLNYTSTTASTFNGVIAGSGNTVKVNQAGASLTLGGANTYTGTTTINVGTLTVNGSTAAGSTVAIASNSGVLTGSGMIGGNTTVNGGTINLSGGTIAGTLIATGGNWNGSGTVSGQVTQQTSGVLTIGAGANLTTPTGVAVTGGTIAGTGTLTGSLNDTSATSSTFGGVIAGSGSTVTVNNAATNLTLSGVNTYGGATTVTTGTLTVNGSTAAGSTVGVASAGTLAGTGTVTGNVSAGSGTVDMTGGHIGGTLTSSGATIGGTETVAGQVTNSSSALTIASGANLTATTGLAITGGTLVAGSASSTITGSVNYTSASSSTYQGVIAGSGSTFTLNNGSAVVTLSGADTFTGATTLTAGTLLVTGSLSGTSGVAVNTGATLAGTGSIHGTTTVNSTGILSPGNGGAGTITVGNLTLNNGAVIDFNLGATPAGSNDLIALNTGTLTFGSGGTTNLDLTTAGTGTGTYTLVSGATTINNFGGETFAISGLSSGLQGAVTTSGTSLVLVLTASPNGYFFTGDAGAGSDLTLLNNYVTTATGTVVPTTPVGPSSDLVFSATGATVFNASLSANTTVDSVTFNSAGSTFLISGSGTLTITNGLTVASMATGTETFSAPVAFVGSETASIGSPLLILSGGMSGTGTLTKAGTGTLEVTQPGGYTGLIVVNGGALDVTANNGLGTPTGITVNSGAALQLGSGAALTNATPLTLNGTGLGGNGALEALGGGTYAGLITLGSSATISDDSGALALTNAGTITGSGFGLTLTGGGAGTLASVIGTGAGTLTKAGAGSWTLSGVNTFTGATTVNAGTLALSGSGSLATSSGVTLNGTSIFDVSGVTASTTVKDLTGAAGTTINLGAKNLTFGTANSTAIASTIQDGGNGGSITKAGTGTVTLSGTNTFLGGATINAGELKVASVSGQLGSGTITLAGGELATTTTSSAANNGVISGSGTFAAAAGTAATYTGLFTGSGAITVGDAANTGTVVLTSNSNVTGTLTIAANATAQVGNGGTTGNIIGVGSLVDNGTLIFDRSNTGNIVDSISGTGRLVQNGTGTVNVTSTNTYSGGTVINSGALQVATVDTNLGTGSITLGAAELITTASALTNTGITLTGAGTIAAAAGSETIYGGVISGSGQALTVGDGTNTGTVTLSGTDTYTGGTTIADGTLQIGFGAAAGSVTGNITNNSALVFNHTGSFTYAGAISGSGTVQTVQGTLNLTGTNTYNGATTITAGTLELSGTGSIADSAVTVGAGTTLASVGTTNSVGALTVNTGSVTLQNNATNTLDGTTLTVAAAGGTVSIDIGATTGASDLLDFSGAATFGVTPLTVNIDSLANAAIGTHYTFITAASGLSASDFTAGALTGALAGDTAVFGLSGNSVYVQINGPLVNTFYYTGATSTDFTDISNYNTTAGGNTVQTTPLGVNSMVFIGANSPTNLAPVLNATSTIGSLSFVSNGATLGGTGTLTLATGDVTTAAGVTGNVTFAPAAILSTTGTWTVTNAAATLTDNGGIGGAGGLVKAGSGTLVLAGADTYAGATTVSAGALNIRNAAALGGTSSVSVTSGAALQIQGGITTSTALPLTLNGTGLSGNGALENISGANTYTGLVTLGSATTIGSDAGTLTLSNVGTITGSGFGLTLAGAGNGVVDSIIGTGAGTLTKTGAGTWTLDGANTFTGGTTISGGTLALGAAGTLANSSGVNLAASGATLDVSSGNHTIQDLSGVAGSTVNLGAHDLTLGTGNSTAYAGTITGTGGSLTKIGAGVLSLSGTNTYTGGTTITAGTLQVAAIDTNLGTGNLSLGGGELLTTTTSATSKTVAFTAGTSTIAAASGTTATYNGAFSGAGAVALNNGSNGGTIVLNAAGTQHGTSIANGTVMVGNADALGVGDVSLSAGTLELTGAAQQINVAGNYTQTGGTLMLNLSGTTAGTSPGYQFLNVTGTAALAGALQINVSNLYVPTVGDMFTFVQAGNITGGFSSVTTNLFSLQVTPQGAGVIISQLPFATLPVTYTKNQLAVAQYVDQSFQGGAAAPAFQQLLASLNSLTAAGSSLSLLPDAFSQLSPDKFENFARTDVINNVSFLTGDLDNYFGTQRSVDGDFIVGNGHIDSSNLTVVNAETDPNLAGVTSQLLAWNPSPIGHGLLSDVPNPVLGGVDMKAARTTEAAPTSDNPINTFIMGSVILAQDFSQADVPHADTTSGEVQLGADYRITPHLRAGAMFGYGHTDATLDDNNSKATTDSYLPGVYLAYAQSGWYANALASYGFDQFTSDRAVSFGTISGVAHGAPSGDQIVGDLDGGYDFHRQNWTFGPTLGVQYTHLDVNGFSEDGLDAADLNVGKQETDSLRSRLGGHVSYLMQAGTVKLTPHLDASWQHEFMDQGRGITSNFSSVGAGSFTIETPNPSRDSALIDAGVNAELNGQVTIFGDYSVQAGQDNYFGQSIQAGVKIGF